MTAVAVITAPGHPTLFESRYLIHDVILYWRPRGVDFTLVVDPRVSPAADIGWQHLDVTTIGQAYRRWLRHYPVTINGATVDVGKRKVASHLVRRNDGWQGPVMVKTELNFGGRADDWGCAWRPLRHPWFHALRNRLPARLTGRMDPGGYPVYARTADVPGWVWGDRRFVVQRFLAEREGGGYGIRRWFFLGPAEFAYRAVGQTPVVAGDDHADWLRLDDVPGDVRDLRARLRLDHGKIDFAVIGGESVVYDVNPAVSVDGPPGCVIQRELSAALVPGFEHFLELARA